MESPVIYIVDDDASVRRALQRLVGSLGMRTETFASPEELLEHGLEGVQVCLLLDVHLPGMNGFELHERIVEAGREDPVIFISAHPDDRARSRAECAGAVAYLEKPVDDRALLAALENALDRVADDPAPVSPRGNGPVGSGRRRSSP
jgi:FixJ family two-component response regulator